ncbi:hypothetical protein SAMN05444921_13445 [Streptomyces wuyuanensis]|uniref:Uncharacterized protein n=1 Tax=Streptomyces wuyuanensis TaxID=1196353 RepID=A0A1H0DKR5_9ACTN|nr:hypothetical protein SAMN05444921_13445 [Streptomyces wuyuanensis]
MMLPWSVETFRRSSQWTATGWNPHVWRDRLPSKRQNICPRLGRTPLKEMDFTIGKFASVMGA